VPINGYPEEPISYPPFSGDDAVCAKCLHVGATTQYREYGECVHGPLEEVIGFGQNQRLHRACRRCDYAWDEHLAVPEKMRPHP
jgi:hypothetical protein